MTLVWTREVKRRLRDDDGLLLGTIWSFAAREWFAELRIPSGGFARQMVPGSPFTGEQEARRALVAAVRAARAAAGAKPEGPP